MRKWGVTTTIWWAVLRIIKPITDSVLLLKIDFGHYIIFSIFLFSSRFKSPLLLLEIQSNFITFIQNWSIATGEQVNYNRRINAEVSKFSTFAMFPNPSGTMPRGSLTCTEQVWEFEPGADNRIRFKTTQFRFLSAAFPILWCLSFQIKIKFSQLSWEMASYIFFW